MGLNPVSELPSRIPHGESLPVAAPVEPKALSRLPDGLPDPGAEAATHRVVVIGPAPLGQSVPAETPSRDQVVQYKDVGTRLTVRPTISADGYVTLEVIQEVSSATTETAFDAPVISTREAATQVLVKDGQTIVLGGLVDHQRDVTSGGLPVLSGIPLLGALFGRQARRTSETELFLFLTPRALRTDEEVDAATQDYQRRPEN